MQPNTDTGARVLAGFAASALLIAAILIATSSGDSREHRGATAPDPPNAARRTYALLAAIPQHGSVLGYPKAPVTLQFFGDLQCAESRQVMLGALPFLIRRWVRAGDLRIRFRSMQTDTRSWSEFREQQSAALAAGSQGRLWNFVSVFYREQGREFSGYADRVFLREIAQRSGVDFERWQTAWDPEAWVLRIVEDAALAKRKGLRSTPAFLIGKTGETARPLRHFALEEPGVFDEAIERLLAA